MIPPDGVPAEDWEKAVDAAIDANHEHYGSMDKVLAAAAPFLRVDLQRVLMSSHSPTATVEQHLIAERDAARQEAEKLRGVVKAAHIVAAYRGTIPRWDDMEGLRDALAALDAGGEKDAG